MILCYPSWKEKVCKICKMVKFYKNLYNLTTCVDFVISFVLSRVWDEKRQFALRSPKWVGVIPQMSHLLPQQKVALLLMLNTWEWRSWKICRKVFLMFSPVSWIGIKNVLWLTMIGCRSLILQVPSTGSWKWNHCHKFTIYISCHCWTEKHISKQRTTCEWVVSLIHKLCRKST